MISWLKLLAKAKGFPAIPPQTDSNVLRLEMCEGHVITDKAVRIIYINSLPKRVLAGNCLRPDPNF
jgi:hypothetical protein